MTFLPFSTLFNMSEIFLKRVGEAKILRNIQGGLDEMLIIAFSVGGRVQKSPKKCLRNVWTVPYQCPIILAHVLKEFQMIFG